MTYRPNRHREIMQAEAYRRWFDWHGRQRRFTRADRLTLTGSTLLMFALVVTAAYRGSPLQWAAVALAAVGAAALIAAVHIEYRRRRD